MFKLNLLSISSMMMLTGCVSLAPSDISAPVVTIPTHIALPENSQSLDIDQIGWREYFNDPQLQLLIDKAINQNSDLKLAILKMQESAKQYGLEERNRYPQINGNASVSYAGANRDQTEHNYNVDAGLSFEFDFFGRLKNLSEAQLQRYLATDEARRNTYLLLISQVANTYLAEQIIFKKLAIVEQQIGSYEQSLKLIYSRMISGQSTFLEYEQAKGMLANAKNSQSELQQSLQLTHNTLKNLLHDYDIHVVAIDDPLMTDIIIPSNLPSNALLTRPDIVQAEYQLKASHADIGVARAAFFPSISLTGSLGNKSTELSDLISGKTLWDLVPKITLPIFNAGKNQLDLDIANIRQQQAVVEYEKTVHNAFKDVSDRLVLRQSYQQQFLLQQNYLQTQQNVSHLANQGYLNGANSYLDILDAQRNIFDSQLNLLTLKQNQLTNEVNLFIALGGGGYE